MTELAKSDLQTSHLFKSNLFNKSPEVFIFGPIHNCMLQTTFFKMSPFIFHRKKECNFDNEAM